MDTNAQQEHRRDGTKSGPAAVPHRRRPEVPSTVPVHITIRLLPHVGNLRSFLGAKILRPAFVAAAERLGTRLCHFSVRKRTIHMIVETDDRVALGRALKGVSVRIARRANKLMGRRGAVIADRYQVRQLRTPAEVRRALVSVLNHPRHRYGHALPAAWIDPYSSARYVVGWRVRVDHAAPAVEGAPVRPPRTWLLARGWRRLGLLDPAEKVQPRASAPPAASLPV